MRPTHKPAAQELHSTVSVVGLLIEAAQCTFCSMSRLLTHLQCSIRSLQARPNATQTVELQRISCDLPAVQEQVVEALRASAEAGLPQCHSIAAMHATLSTTTEASARTPLRTLCQG